MKNALEQVRDDRLEVQVIAHLMQHPQTAPAYDAARCETRLFANPVRRQVWGLISECLEDGIAPAWMNLETRAKARKLEEITASYLLQFDREPLPRLEAEAIAQHVGRLRVLAEARDEYLALTRDAGELLANPERLADIRARAVTRTTGTKAESGFLLAGELHDRHIEPIVDGLLEPDTVAFLWGPTNEGKSFLTADLAVAVASGGYFFGRRCRQSPVAMLVYEGTSRFRRRLDAAAAVRGLTSCAGLPIHVNLGPPGLADAGGIARVKRFQEREGVLVSIVDTFHAACRGVLDIDSGSGGDAGRALEALRLLRPPGGVVIAVHHPGLTAKDRMRGAGAILAAADTEIQVDAGVIRSRKQRDLPSNFRAGFRLSPQDGTLVVVPTDAPPPKEDEDNNELIRKVTAALRATPNASANQIHTAVGGNRALVLSIVAYLRAGGSSGSGNHWEPSRTGSSQGGSSGSGSKEPEPGTSNGNHPHGTTRRPW